MRNIYFILFTFCFGFSLNAQIVNIPDANFKFKLLQASPSNQIASSEVSAINGGVTTYNSIDINNDGEIQVSEATLIKYLDISTAGISSLDGVLSFINLQHLKCWGNLLPSLNVSGLTNLLLLNCSNNQLPSLNVSGLTSLKILTCNNNQLPSLNVNGLTSLESLHCDYNLIPSLNVSGLTSLKSLTCSNNQLPSLNVSGLTSLKSLNCSNNQLPIINVNGLTSLESLFCSNNQLPSLNVSGLTNLLLLNCSNNQLSSLNVSGLTSLIGLSCNNNQLTSLNVSNLTNLLSLSCSNNQLISLNIKNDGAWWNYLNFGNNPNMQFVCADTAQIIQVQDLVATYGYANCVVNSDCLLENQNFDIINYFSISPNPVKDILTIQTKENIEVSSINIYNTLGQLVLLIPNAKDISTIDVSSLKAGNYFIKVLSDKGVSSTKFIKE